MKKLPELFFPKEKAPVQTHSHEACYRRSQPSWLLSEERQSTFPDSSLDLSRTKNYAEVALFLHLHKHKKAHF